MLLRITIVLLLFLPVQAEAAQIVGGNSFKAPYILPADTRTFGTMISPSTEGERAMRGTVKRYIRSVFGVHAENAIRIARQESRFDVEAYNPEWHNGCRGSFGVFQIACVNYNGYYNELYNYKTNVRVAHKIFHKHGWSAWLNSARDLGILR